LNHDGIWGYDPVALVRVWGASHHMSYPWNNMAFNAAGDRFYFYQGNGSVGQGLRTFDCRYGRIGVGTPVVYPLTIDFASAGRRVWAVCVGSPTAFGESLEYSRLCEAVGATISPITCDAVLDRTFVSDVNSSRVVVFRDTLRDSLDIACTRVVGPLQRPDTGGAVVFRTALVNCGSLEKTSTVRLRVYPADRLGLDRYPDSFQDSAAVLLDGCGYSAVAFDTWRPTARGRYTVEATAAWSGDVNPSNDTAHCFFVVGTPFIDVRPLRILSPTGVVDSGTAVVPKSRILNRGTVAVSCQVQMAIGTQYRDVQSTNAIAPGDSQLVSFASWTATELGNLSVRCSTMLADDSLPQNDLLRSTVQVQRPGGVEAIDSMPTSFFVTDWSPNPTRTAASLRYGLPRAAEVRVSIFSVDGRQVRTLVNGLEPAGYRCVRWDGRDAAGCACAPAVYFCRADVGPLRKSHKLTVTR